MTPIDIIETLDLAGIELSLEGDNIRAHGKEGPPTSEQVSQIRQHKDKLVAYLRKSSQSNQRCREYRYPDGRVLKLTQEQFEAVCDSIRMLVNAERKQKGKPLLQG